MLKMSKLLDSTFCATHCRKRTHTQSPCNMTNRPSAEEKGAPLVKRKWNHFLLNWPFLAHLFFQVCYLPTFNNKYPLFSWYSRTAIPCKGPVQSYILLAQVLCCSPVLYAQCYQPTCQMEKQTGPNSRTKLRLSVLKNVPTVCFLHRFGNRESIFPVPKRQEFLSVYQGIHLSWFFESQLMGETGPCLL